ncbi:hypothetical protein Cgig2_017706 [Carnegiea gigantea]|uniref:Uncharacterized protein n=1 Tax=Carnegiea gigantea TaxID=171969 RepID=A0A9Q1K305_9CARY|nr:hypothetical protein Cgig2_017706 [Carnegiea gigantea]
MNGDRENLQGERSAFTIDEETKRIGIGDPLTEDNDKDREGMEMELGSPRVLETQEEMERDHLYIRPISYRNTLQKNNPNLNIDMRDNPIWANVNYGDVAKDDEPSAEEGPTCPTILLTTKEETALGTLAEGVRPTPRRANETIRTPRPPPVLQPSGNIQGAGSSKVLNVLKAHIRLHRPSIVAPIETHISRARAQAVCAKIDFVVALGLKLKDFQGKFGSCGNRKR